jgi:hypothetical protein
MSDDDLLVRIARLEHSQRRLQRFGIGTVLVLAAVVAWLVVARRAIEASSLRLVDDQGRVRVLLTVASGLSFLDADGKARAILGVDQQGPGLALFGDQSRAILNVSANGPALVYTGALGKVRSIFTLLPDGPGLVLYDAQEQERAAVAVHDDGPHLQLLGADGKETWAAP